MEKFQELKKINYKRKGIRVCSNNFKINKLEIKSDIVNFLQYENITHQKNYRRNKIFQTKKPQCVSVNKSGKKIKLTVPLTKKVSTKNLEFLCVSLVSEYDDTNPAHLSKLQNKINVLVKNT